MQEENIQEMIDDAQTKKSDLLKQLNVLRENCSYNRFDKLGEFISSLNYDDLELIALIIMEDEKAREFFEEYLQHEKSSYIKGAVFIPVGIGFAVSVFILPVMLPRFLDGDLHALIITGTTLGGVIISSGIIALCVALINVLVNDVPVYNPFETIEKEKKLRQLDDAVMRAEKQIDRETDSTVVGQQNYFPSLPSDKDGPDSSSVDLSLQSIDK
jgi:hypothetical protein